MIDRQARDLAILAIEAFLDDRMGAFEFAERLGEIKTEDATVRYVVKVAWYHYDDCRDHKVCFSKQQWDLFQRLLLLLSSDLEIVVVKKKRWAWDHGLALAGLVGFLGLAFYTGWGEHLFALTIPFGALSMLISFYRARAIKGLSTFELACYPFTAIAPIALLKEHAPQFVKRRYRKEIGERIVWSDSEQKFNHLRTVVPWLLCSPVVLLVQSFAMTVREYATIKE